MAIPDNKPVGGDIQGQLLSIQEECKRLQEENARLRVMLGIPESKGDRVGSQVDAS
jgi:cell shape-determining protein MreC